MDARAKALEYRALGLAVFPLPWGEKDDARRWGTFAHAPPDERELHVLFNGEPQNIAVICGAASGNLLDLDADTPDVYAENLARLAGLGITTWTVRREPNGTPHDGGGAFIVCK